MSRLRSVCTCTPCPVHDPILPPGWGYEADGKRRKQDSKVWEPIPPEEWDEVVREFRVDRFYHFMEARHASVS